MDRRDVALLSNLFRDPRAAYVELGERVGLSPNAVKARVRKLEEQGVLQGFAAAPTPALLGMGEGLLVFSDIQDLAEREEDVLRSLPDLPGVRFVDVTLDGSVMVWAYARDDADWERVERAAVSVVGKPPARATFRPCTAPTVAEPTEWRVIRALLPDARAPLKELASRSGLSLRTVQRRLSGLLTSGHVRLEPVLSPSEASGLALYTLHAELKTGVRVEDILKLLPEGVIAQTSSFRGGITFHGARDTLREAQADHRAVRRHAGVERVIFSIATRRRADSWLDDAILERLAAAPPMPRPAPVPMPLRPRK